MLKNNQNNDWPNVIRIVHLNNGLRAINHKDPYIEVYPYNNGNTLNIDLSNFKDLQLTLKKHNLRIYGIDFYTNQKQINGLQPKEWRVFNFNDTEFPAQKNNRIWRQIANASIQHDCFELMDLANRIAYQVDACSYELLKISENYNKALETKYDSSEYINETVFSNLYTFPIHQSINNFFSNCSTLRDYLAEFIANFILKNQLYRPNDKRIKLMKTVVTRIKDINHPIANIIKDISKKEEDMGWLYKMTCYRDLVVHYAPIALAEGNIDFLHTKPTELTYNGKIYNLPGISFPLPNNPELLIKKRSKNELYKSVHEWAADNKISSFINKDGKKDALQYCYETFCNIAQLALTLTEYSPYKPEQITLNIDDGAILKVI